MDILGPCGSQVSEERGGRSCSWHGCMFGGMRIDHRRVSAQRRAVRGNFTVGHSVGMLSSTDYGGDTSLWIQKAGIKNLESPIW